MLEKIAGHKFDIRADCDRTVRVSQIDEYISAFVDAMSAAPSDTIERLHRLIREDDDQMPPEAIAILSDFDAAADAALADEWIGKPSASIFVHVNAL